jgi:hypothetical protein
VLWSRERTSNEALVAGVGADVEQVYWFMRKAVFEMNSLYKAVLKVACPTCKAQPGERCVGNPPLRKLHQWHYARLLARPPLGGNPCFNCAKGNHSQCRGHHQRSHGMEGQPCTCECRRARSEA